MVEIRGASYLVEPIAAGECGVSAVRLVKRSSREAYDVIRQHDGSVACDCPSYTFRYKGTGLTCKHGVAAMAHGLLPVARISPAPADEPSGLAADDEAACPIDVFDHREPRALRSTGFVPSAEESAEWAMIRDREEREAEDREYDQYIDRLAEERMEAAFGQPGDGWNIEETIRARGGRIAALLTHQHKGRSGRSRPARPPCPVPIVPPSPRSSPCPGPPSIPFPSRSLASRPPPRPSWAAPAGPPGRHGGR